MHPFKLRLPTLITAVVALAVLTVAIDWGATSGVAEANHGVIAKPTQPTGISGDGTITFTWGGTHDADAGYEFRYAEGTAGRLSLLTGAGAPAWEAHGTNSGSTSLTIGNTEADAADPNPTEVGKTYYLQVRGKDTDDTVGEASDISSGVLQRAAPAKLGNVQAAAGDAQVSLSWDNPNDATIANYDYRIDPDPSDGSSGWTGWQRFTTTNNSHTVTGLTNGTTYSFQVRANNNQGVGPDSDTVTATPSGPPAAPDLRADPGDGEVRLYWANPDDSSITKYQKHEKKGDEAYGLWEDISFPDTVDISSDDPIQYTVTELDSDGTAYTFQVRAFNNGGIGAVGTATATPTASETAPAQMSGLIAAVSGVSGGTGGQVRFTWDNPGDSAIDKYQYRYDGSSSNPDSWDRDWTDVPSSVGTTTSYPAGAGTVGLHGSSDTVFYEFRAVNDGADVGSTADVNEGGGLATAVRVDRSNTPTTSAQPPATPTDLTATATPGQVALGWTVPSGTGVTAPTNHEYRQSTDGGESFGNWMSTGKATAGHTVTTLTDGQEYTFEVRGFTGSGDSKVNGASTRVGPVIPGAPNAPTGLAVTAIEDDTSTTDADESNPNALNLIWTPGAGIDGVTLADYEYRQSVSGAVSWSAWNSISGDGSETTYTVIELLPSTTYSFQVRAVAGALESDPSDAASGTTADPPADQPLVAPDAPTGLRAAAGNEQATLTWSNPDNRYILRYRYRVALEGTVIDTVDWQQIDGSDKDTTSHTVTDLTNGATYSFQVQAVGAGSMIGTASETVTATPRPPTGGGGTSVPQRDSVTAHNSDRSGRHGDRHRRLAANRWQRQGHHQPYRDRPDQRRHLLLPGAGGGRRQHDRHGLRNRNRHAATAHRRWCAATGFRHGAQLG